MRVVMPHMWCRATGAVVGLLWFSTLSAGSRCEFKQIESSSLEPGFEQGMTHPLLIQTAGSGRTAEMIDGLGNITLYITTAIGNQAQHGFTQDEQIAASEYIQRLETNKSIPYAFRQCHLSPSCDRALAKAVGIPSFLRETARELFMAVGSFPGSFPLHSHDRTWALSLAGSKRWFTSPPGKPPLRPYVDHDEDSLKRAGFQYCVQHEGEVVFLPRGWWHAVIVQSNWSLTVGGQGASKDLVFSACRGDLAAFTSSRPHQLNRLDPSGISPAGHAARAGHAKLLATFREKGADLQSPDGNGWTLAHHAAKLGHVEVIQWLAEGGISVTERNRMSWTALHTAAKAGNVEVIRALLQARAMVEPKDQAHDFPNVMLYSMQHAHRLVRYTVRAQTRNVQCREVS
ncbi:ankrd52 [Symbiodinium natans]|uniref:Ankrd52 protein n=1 Tax=Symbiodinium natans TaxID=878477 RepID=A0A812ICP6_9DINO|nr:ankrd52 [Symbiodinium natans]